VPVTDVSQQSGTDPCGDSEQTGETVLQVLGHPGAGAHQDGQFYEGYL